MSDWSTMMSPDEYLSGIQNRQAPVWPVQQQPSPPSTIDAATLATMQERLVREQLPVSADGILLLWQRTKEHLATAKDDEMNIRKIAVKVFIPTPKEGMNTIALGNDYELKAAVNFNYTLDSDTDKVAAVQAEISKVGNRGPMFANSLFKWSADLILSQYRVLQEEAATFSDIAEIKRLVDSVLTTSEKAPTLEIKEPKKKGT